MPLRNINDLGNEAVMKEAVNFLGSFFIAMKTEIILTKLEEKEIQISDAQKNALRNLNEYEIDNMNRKSVRPSRIELSPESWRELRDYIVAAKNDIKQEKKEKERQAKRDKQEDELQRALNQADKAPMRVDTMSDYVSLVYKAYDEMFASNPGIEVIKKFQDKDYAANLLYKDENYAITKSDYNQFRKEWKSDYEPRKKTEKLEEWERMVMTKDIDIDAFKLLVKCIFGMYEISEVQLHGLYAYFINYKRRLLGIDTQKPQMLCLYGSQAKNKSSVMKALIKGQNRIDMLNDLDIPEGGQRYDVARAHNELRSQFSSSEARRGIMFYDELDRMDLDDVATLKGRITNDDKVSVDKKHRDMIYVSPRASYASASNQDPALLFAACDTESRRLLILKTDIVRYQFAYDSWEEQLSYLFELMIRSTPIGNENDEIAKSFKEWVNESNEYACTVTAQRYNDDIDEFFVDIIDNTLMVPDKTNTMYGLKYADYEYGGLAHFINKRKTRSIKSFVQDLADDWKSFNPGKSFPIPTARMIKYFIGNPDYYTQYEGGKGQLSAKFFNAMCEKHKIQKKLDKSIDNQTVHELEELSQPVIASADDIIERIQKELGRKINCLK